ncbi:hypothetical protein CJO09_01930 [Neopusillimonas maritima]|uniref:Homogentisate 1,2-dioxygenase n=1 Tax=Neopusillimonas maritima TaxID=2026239 RepID=A0ABX9N2R2_9BURK|nr:hypothetical protein CJO09_01930 [Neopusillimonas maritima]
MPKEVSFTEQHVRESPCERQGDYNYYQTLFATDPVTTPELVDRSDSRFNVPQQLFYGNVFPTGLL